MQYLSFGKLRTASFRNGPWDWGPWDWPNIVGAGCLAGGPPGFALSEGFGIGAAFLDVGAASLYFSNALVNGGVRSWVKFGVSAGSVFTDLAFNASVAVKPAVYGSRYYLKATGRYVGNATGTLKALKPYIIGAGVDKAGDIITDSF